MANLLDDNFPDDEANARNGCHSYRSAISEYFKDFLEKKDESEYKDMFIRYKDFWENGEPTPEQTDIIYKRKPRAPYIEAKFADGTTEKV